MANFNHSLISSIHPLDARVPHFCPWLWGTMTIHCDGNVSCGLDDPFEIRSYGNVGTQSVREIWTSPEMAERRRRLLRGDVCRDCQLYLPVSAHGGDLPPPTAPLPDQLIVEPTIRCNLRCPQAFCIPNNDPNVQTRRANDLPLEIFNRVIDESGRALKRIYLFNYGEPLLHPHLEEMVAHAKAVNPDVWITTSTNGIPLRASKRADALVEAGIDQIHFTIGGARQETYERYHVRGRLEHALEGMANVCRARDRLGRGIPEVIWRYLMFHWNDSDEEIDEARAIARETGVGKLLFHLTQTPPGAASRQRAPGSPGHAKIQDSADFAFGYSAHLPDGDGFYHWEVDPHLSNMRWASASARLWFAPRGAWIALSLATNNPLSRDRPTRVTLSTPWGEFLAEAGFAVWRDVFVPVPPRHRTGERIEVRIQVEQPWCPLALGLGDDPRTLGVMIRPGHLGDDDGGVRHPVLSPDSHGLYSHEWNRRFGGYHWTSPIAQFELPIRRGVASLRVTTVAPHAGERPTKMTINSPWGRRDVSVTPGEWQNVKLRPPHLRRLKAPGSLLIELELESDWRPADDFGGGDTRQLGVMVAGRLQNGGTLSSD